MIRRHKFNKDSLFFGHCRRRVTRRLRFLTSQFSARLLDGSIPRQKMAQASTRGGSKGAQTLLIRQSPPMVVDVSPSPDGARALRLLTLQAAVVTPHAFTREPHKPSRVSPLRASRGSRVKACDVTGGGRCGGVPKESGDCRRGGAQDGREGGIIAHRAPPGETPSPGHLQSYRTLLARLKPGVPFP
jgi:hypothetical protein